MGTFSIWHWLILLAIAALLFGGKGRISSMMGDVAHGIRNFRDGLKDPNAPAASESKRIADEKRETVDSKKVGEKTS